MPRQDGTSYITAGLSRRSGSLTSVIFQTGGRSVVNATTGADENMVTYTLPANTLNGPSTLTGSGFTLPSTVTTAKGLRIRGFFSVGGGGGAKTVGIKFGGTSLVTAALATTVSGQLICEVFLWRTGAQAADAFGNGLGGTVLVVPAYNGLSGTAFNFSGAGGVPGVGIVIAFYCNQASTASDITFRAGIVELLTEGSAEL